MTDTRTDLPAEVDVAIDDRDTATREATRQIVAGVAELRDAIGRTPYITTVINSVAEIVNALGRLANVTEKAEHWLDVNGKATARAADHVDVDELLKDLRRDLKGVTAGLEKLQRDSYRSTSRAWSAISTREDLIGRETW